MSISPKAGTRKPSFSSEEIAQSAINELPESWTCLYVPQTRTMVTSLNLRPTKTKKENAPKKKKENVVPV